MPVSEPQAPNRDWPSTLVELRRRIASHLRGWDAADIDDCLQDAALRLVRAVDRHGWPRNPCGLFTVIARRAAIDFIRIRRRRPSHLSIHANLEVLRDCEFQRMSAELDEEVRAKAFRVLHYFHTHHARCEPLARARAEGLDLKTFAEQSGQSHGAVLQQWSRCVRRLFDGIRRGALPWPWPIDRA